MVDASFSASACLLTGTKRLGQPATLCVFHPPLQFSLGLIPAGMLLFGISSTHHKLFPTRNPTTQRLLRLLEPKSPPQHFCSPAGIAANHTSQTVPLRGLNVIIPSPRHLLRTSAGRSTLQRGRAQTHLVDSTAAVLSTMHHTRGRAALLYCSARLPGQTICLEP